MKRIAILASGSGSNFSALVSACHNGEIDGIVALLLYDRKDAYVSVRAQNLGIESVYLNKFMFDAETRNRDLDNAMLDLLQYHNIDIVVLAGYLSKIGEHTINCYTNKIVNTHPALIPAFCGMGMFGHNVHEAVINYGAKISGCTIHFVDSQMDTGAIIAQQSVPVYFEDTPDDLAARVLEVEHKLLPYVVGLLCADRLLVEGRRVQIL